VAFGPLAGFVAFCGVALLAAALAPYGYGAWLKLLEIGAFGAVGLLAARCGPDWLVWAGRPLLVVASLQTALAAWQRVTGGEARPAGTFLNTNHLAAWVVAVCLLTAGAALAPGRREARPWSRIALPAIVLGLALLVSGSRGALIGLLAGGGYLVLQGWRGWPRRRKLAIGATALLIVAVAAAAQLRRLAEEDPFRYQRFRIWHAAIQTTLDAPWLGVGPGQFVAASRNYQFPEEDGPFRYDRSFFTTHSDVIRVWSALGLAGVAGLVLAGGAAIRSIRKRRREGALAPTTTGAIAALWALAGQALVENLSTRPALYLLAGALLGSLLSIPRDPANPPRLTAWARVGLGWTLLVVFAIGDVAPYLAWRAADSTPQPRGRLGEADAARLERAIRLNPIRADYWTRRAAHLSSDESDWTVETYAEARRSAETAVRLSPLDPETHRHLARVEAAACLLLFRDVKTRERAAARFRHAERLARRTPFIPLELAVFLLENGDPTGARRAAERALELEPESVAPRIVLAEALLEQGGPDAPERAARLVAEAEAKFERWADWLTAGDYARELLRPNPRLLDEIGRRLAEARETQPPGTPSGTGGDGP
jgi:O-antigen ligase